MTLPLAVLLLAAGRSSRMRGRDKLLEPIHGQPLLSLMCKRILESGLECFVTLPSPSHPRAALIGTAHPCFVPDAAEGMGASIRKGVAALPDTVEGVMLLPADMPEIDGRDLHRLAQAFGGATGPVIRGCGQDGTPGHPVLFPRRLFCDLKALNGDRGARDLLKAETVIPVPLAGEHAVTDLDTPEEWVAWRRAQRP